MTEKELEYLLLENLKYAKENNHYLIKVDRRQRLRRTWTAIYWTLIVVLAIGGYFYAFPYLQVLRDQFTAINGQIGTFLNFTDPAN